MSAFQCSRDHVALVAARWVSDAEKFARTQERDANLLARFLMEANRESLRERYADRLGGMWAELEIAVTRDDVARAASLTPGAALKLIDCYVYQCTDWSRWNESAARHATDDLVRWQVWHLDLESWERMPWGIAAWSDVPPEVRRQ